VPPKAAHALRVSLKPWLRLLLFACACAFVTPALAAAAQAIHLENIGSSQGGWVSIADNPGLRLQRFTAEMWIKPLGPGFGHTDDAPGSTLFAKPDQGGVGGGPLSYHMGWCPTTQQLDFLLTHTPPDVYVNFTSNGRAPLGAWTHVAFTFDGCQMHILINGVEDASVAYPYASVYYGSEPILIGAGNYLAPFLRRYQGLIDDVRLWNYARSASQVAAQMNCPLRGTEAGLVAYWKMDGDLFDATAHGSDGLLVGTATWADTGGTASSCSTTGVPQSSAPSRITLSGGAVRGQPMLQFSFALPAAGDVSLDVFDLAGRKVATLLDHVRIAEGRHQASWPIRSAPAGAYFARLRAGTQSASCVALVLK
jgi:hypothetical protein